MLRWQRQASWGAWLERLFTRRSQIGRPVPWPLFLDRLCHLYVSENEQNCLLGLWFGWYRQHSASKMHMLVVGSPFLCSITFPFPAVKLCRALLPSLWGKPEVGVPMQWSTILGEWDVHLDLSFPHWRNHRLKGDLSVWCCTDLEEGQCRHQGAPPPPLLMPFVLVSVVQGAALASPLCSANFSVMPYPWIVVSCSPCEGDRSW